MASKLKPSRPAFDTKAPPEPKKKKKAKAVKSEPVTVRVTAGPFFDDRHPRRHEGWVVITRQGDLVTYHRFPTKEAAQGFAAGF